MKLSLSFLPKQDRFFFLLHQSTLNIREVARRLQDLMENFENVPAKVQEIKDLEEFGDQIIHDITHSLHRTFVTPIDREDILALAGRLDDVLDAIDEAAIDEYLRSYATPEGIRRGLAYYRAIPDDIADNRAFAETGRLSMPVLALGGASSRGRGREPLDSLAAIADLVEGGAIEDCGHFLPEEQPEVLARRLLAFFAKHG